MQVHQLGKNFRCPILEAAKMPLEVWLRKNDILEKSPTGDQA